MTEQFKAGDNVICSDNEGCEHLLDLGKNYEVSSSYREYLEVYCKDKECTLPPLLKSRFRLVEEEEEVLPAVPDSVMYIDEEYPKDVLTVNCQLNNLLHISAENSYAFDANQSTDIFLSPESALQLASDIRRMALKMMKEPKYGD